MNINLRKLALYLAAVTVLSMFVSCADRSNEVTSVEDSVSEPEASGIKTGESYTREEAASINASISPSDIDLVQLRSPVAGSQVALVRTTMGDFEILLFPDHAPKAVTNFVTHAKEGYYNGQIFDKVIKNFIIEGGDPDGFGGKSIYKDEDGKPSYFEIETSLDLWHFRGAVSMSLMEGQEGNGSRFFIIQAPFVDDETVEGMTEIGYPQKVLDQYKNTGGTPGFDSKRTVFGMLTVESLKVLDEIAAVPTDADGNPEEAIIIESIEIKTLTAGDIAKYEDRSDES